ncbi:hypothetical protein HW452_09995 [Halomonas aquamarina]|uniref:Uncharacterized protein n=1 Tax=Vreelandella aquamarina TaxID=77097 RepID=A0ACC5VW21_9GAMM|nr:hypothetical protein [Halomonas aquamarina]MBZ5487857.1 hypothetical protein [Halomonas aquamarina]
MDKTVSRALNMRCKSEQSPFSTPQFLLVEEVANPIVHTEAADVAEEVRSEQQRQGRGALEDMA